MLRYEDVARIYFLEAVGCRLVKIGYSLDVLRRVSAIAVSCPVELRLRALLPGGPSDERELHRRFAADRSHGEWFRITPAIAALMAEHKVDQVLRFNAAAPPVAKRAVRPSRYEWSRDAVI